ncbi:putative enzyme involved in methoxymalonyl-ACP biosynthesis [Rhodococcus sp. 27YEA15]|uniref:hypothetical protein n=1 Tax=Rhodococcus sp. 27YEA15 TaxID=3156259 RepID=UPI003C7D6047
MSCRVFSCGIEQASLAALLDHAHRHGVTAVTGEYRRSSKNHKVRDFYTRSGFAQVSDDGSLTIFRHELETLPAAPDHVRVTAELEGTTA